MAALRQGLLRLRDASKAALIVVHHVRKSNRARRDRHRTIRTKTIRLPRVLGAASRGRLLPAAHTRPLSPPPSSCASSFVTPRRPSPRLLQLDPHTSPAGHRPGRLFPAHRETGYRRLLPTSLHRAGPRAVSTAALNLAILRRVALTQTLPRGERGPEAGDGSAAQTCSSVQPPPAATTAQCRSGFTGLENDISYVVTVPIPVIARLYP